jgi:hypothetical protein
MRLRIAARPPTMGRRASEGSLVLRVAPSPAPETLRVCVRWWHAFARRPVVCLATLFVLVGCSGPPRAASESQTTTAPGSTLTAAHAVFLDTLGARTFRFFWERSDPQSGLTPDRWPTRSFASVSATGFALTAYPIGIEHHWVDREAAATRVRNTLRFFWTAPQGTAAAGMTGYRGFFYHFLDPATGHRFEDVELSTVDTALLLAGARFCAGYFDGKGGLEGEIRALADSLCVRADWTWASIRPPMISHGWDPENGHLPYDWRGYSEAMLVYLLGLGSTSHPAAPGAWESWTEPYRWGTFQGGKEYVGFAPLFGHQYTHVWVDFRGIQDAPMRTHRTDYFENSRQAVLAQQAYAISNPMGWKGYGATFWGLTACDGPLEGRVTIEGREREFHTYWARGASFSAVDDDGTVSPSAAGGSIVFAPDLVIPALVAMRDMMGGGAYGRYGFVDAVNPTLDIQMKTQHGRVEAGIGWFDTDYLGIDQGPILAMLENHRSELVWRVMRRDRQLVRGLRAAGFQGGWLDTAPREKP